MGDSIKVIKDSNHSLISNYHLRDKRLSWGAKGLLSTMLALSGEYTYDELEKMSHNNAFASNGEFAELEKCGYLTWKQCGIESGAPVLEYTIYEKPISNCSARDPVAEIMDPEDMPVSLESIDKAEKQKLRERLGIDKLIKQNIKGDSFYISIIEVSFCELCKREADFQNMMNAIAFKKVCDIVIEWQTEYIARGLNFPMLRLINRAFDNIQEAQRGGRKQQKGTLERESGKV